MHATGRDWICIAPIDKEAYNFRLIESIESTPPRHQVDGDSGRGRPAFCLAHVLILVFCHFTDG